MQEKTTGTENVGKSFRGGTNDDHRDQSSGSLVVKTLASHASGRGFDAPGGLSSKKFPLGGSQNVCDAGSPCYEALASD